MLRAKYAVTLTNVDESWSVSATEGDTSPPLSVQPLQLLDDLRVTWAYADYPGQLVPAIVTCSMLCANSAAIPELSSGDAFTFTMERPTASDPIVYVSDRFRADEPVIKTHPRGLQVTLTLTHWLTAAGETLIDGNSPLPLDTAVSRVQALGLQMGMAYRRSSAQPVGQAVGPTGQVDKKPALPVMFDALAGVTTGGKGIVLRAMTRAQQLAIDAAHPGWYDFSGEFGTEKWFSYFNTLDLDAAVGAVYTLGVLAPGGAPPAPVTFADVVLADSPQAFYRLAEASGTVMGDSSGHARAGAYSGTLTLAQAGLLTGDTNSCVSFGGGRGQVNYDATWMNNAEFSIEARFNAANVSGIKTITARDVIGNNADLQSRIRLNGNKVEFLIRAGGVTSVRASTATITAGTSYTVVGVVRGLTMELWINGVLDGSWAITAAPQATTAPFLIGALAGGQEPFAGRIDEVSFYAFALSSGRIGAHHTAATTAPVSAGGPPSVVIRELQADLSTATGLVISADDVLADDVEFRRTRDDATNQVRLTGLHATTGEAVVATAGHADLIDRYGPNTKSVDTQIAHTALAAAAAALLAPHEDAEPRWTAQDFTFTTQGLTDAELDHYAPLFYPAERLPDPGVDYMPDIAIPMAIVGVSDRYSLTGPVLTGHLTGAVMVIRGGEVQVQGTMSARAARTAPDALTWAQLRADASVSSAQYRDSDGLSWDASTIDPSVRPEQLTPSALRLVKA